MYQNMSRYIQIQMNPHHLFQDRDSIKLELVMVKPSFLYYLISNSTSHQKKLSRPAQPANRVIIVMLKQY
jgi:hypothetical protein